MRARTALTATAAGLALLAAAPGAPAAPSACAGADAVPTASTVAGARAAILCLVNEARAGRGVPAVRADAHLRRAAERYAQALRPSRPLSHTGAGGSTPLDRIAASGYAHGDREDFDVGETLGRSVGTSARPSTRVRTWLQDPGTRRLLLAKRFRDAGVGIVVAGGRTTFVVELAAPRQPAAGPASSAATDTRSASASSKRASGSSRRAPNSSRSWFIR